MLPVRFDTLDPRGPHTPTFLWRLPTAVETEKLDIYWRCSTANATGVLHSSTAHQLHWRDNKAINGLVLARTITIDQPDKAAEADKSYFILYSLALAKTTAGKLSVTYGSAPCSLEEGDLPFAVYDALMYEMLEDAIPANITPAGIRRLTVALILQYLETGEAPSIKPLIKSMSKLMAS
jgi:hypothetical protein